MHCTLPDTLAHHVHVQVLHDIGMCKGRWQRDHRITHWGHAKERGSAGTGGQQRFLFARHVGMRTKWVLHDPLIYLQVHAHQCQPSAVTCVRGCSHPT